MYPIGLRRLCIIKLWLRFASENVAVNFRIGNSIAARSGFKKIDCY